MWVHRSPLELLQRHDGKNNPNSNFRFELFYLRGTKNKYSRISRVSFLWFYMKILSWLEMPEETVYISSRTLFFWRKNATNIERQRERRRRRQRLFVDTQNTHRQKPRHGTAPCEVVVRVCFSYVSMQRICRPRGFGEWAIHWAGIHPAANPLAHRPPSSDEWTRNAPAKFKRVILKVNRTS